MKANHRLMKFRDISRMLDFFYAHYLKKKLKVSLLGERNDIFLTTLQGNIIS